METSTILYGVAIFVLVIILFGMFYYYYFMPLQTNVEQYKMLLLSGPVKFHEKFQQITPVSALVGSRPTLYVPYLGSGLSFVWEMHIPNHAGNSGWYSSYNQLKPILQMEDSPQIAYQPKKNYLSVSLKYRDNPFLAKFTEIKYKNIKLQTWVKYIVVISSNNVRIYENGNIVLSKILEGVPVLYDYGSKIILGQPNNNCQCNIKNFYMYPYPLSTTEISTL